MLCSDRATAALPEKQDRTGFRFARGHRLADAASFSRVFDDGQRSRDALFTILYRPNGSDAARLGLAIGKKHCRRATGRNRLKRIVRESFRHNRDRLGGVDVVVLNQPAAATADNEALFSSLERHWQRCRARPATRQDKN